MECGYELRRRRPRDAWLSSKRQGVDTKVANAGFIHGLRQKCQRGLSLVEQITDWTRPDPGWEGFLLPRHGVEHQAFGTGRAHGEVANRVGLRG
jgi:hypothetical protein